MVIRPMAYVTLTIDHRVVDSHQTSAWLTRFVEILESWLQPEELMPPAAVESAPTGDERWPTTNPQTAIPATGVAPTAGPASAH